MLAVGAPAKTPCPFMDQEHFCGEMQMQVIGYPFRHSRRANVKAVRLGDINNLLAGLSYTRADEGIVLFEMRTGQLAINKGKIAGNHIVGGD